MSEEGKLGGSQLGSYAKDAAQYVFLRVDAGDAQPVDLGPAGTVSSMGDSGP
jgi:hypothetical protein